MAFSPQKQQSSMSFGFCSWNLLLGSHTRILPPPQFYALLLSFLSLTSSKTLSYSRTPTSSSLWMPLTFSSTRRNEPLLMRRKIPLKKILSLMALELQRRKPSLSSSDHQKSPVKASLNPVLPKKAESQKKTEMDTTQ